MTVKRGSKGKRGRKKIFKFSAQNPSKIVSFSTPKTTKLSKTHFPTTNSSTPNMNQGNSNTNNVKLNMNNSTPNFPICFSLNYNHPKTALLDNKILNRNNILIKLSLLRNRTAISRTISISPRNITRLRGKFPKKISMT